MIPTLHIQLLGGFRLACDATPVTTLDSPRLQAVLAYLLLHRDTPQARAHLAFQLWPDTTEAQAHANLRTLLHRLRHALPHADQFLHVDAQTVQWRPDAPYTLDVADVEHALTQAQAAAQRADHATVHAALEAAAARYQGELLPALYDDWVLVERERLRQAFLAGLEKLILLLEQQREYAAAIGYAQRLLRHDPLHEGTYQHLMRLHTLSGDRASALRVYHTCATILERELGVEPSPATREAYEYVLRMDLPPAPSAIPSTPAPLPARHNLPAQLTQLIGRTEEVAAVCDRLRHTQIRLLTLTGPGGTGKTRLALQVGAALLDDFADGVYFVDLAPIRDRALVASTIAQILGVKESGDQPLLAGLKAYLRGKQLLLVLDNFEQILAAAPLVVELLLAASDLKVLVTSRAVLHLSGEHEFVVPPLAVPDPAHLPPLNQLSQYTAMRLFTVRAQAVQAAFTLTTENAPAVAGICQRLDGLPLAIELAAACSKLFAPKALSARLRNRLAVLAGGPRDRPARQQTLRNTIDWSYQLLSEREQTLLRRLAVFVGGCTLDAAEVVCAADDHLAVDVTAGVALLVDQSLLRQSEGPGGEPRLTMLETIREYALERLAASGEEPVVRWRYATFYAALAEQVAPCLTHAERRPWLARLGAEHTNLRVALAWGDEKAAHNQMALQLAGDLSWFWYFRGEWSEGRRWLEKLLAASDTAGVFGARAKALDGAGMLAWLQGDYVRARAWLEESVALWRTLDQPERLAFTLGSLGFTVLGEGNLAEACARFDESVALCQEVNDRWCLALSLYGLGEVAKRTGDSATQARCEASLAVWREIGDAWGIALPLATLGDFAIRQGDYVMARTYLQESLLLLQEAGEQSMTA